MSSMELMPSQERVCYVHCNLCNTILAVSVPAFNSVLTTATTSTLVTVRCGHCANLLSVNIGAASLQYYSAPPNNNPSSTITTATTPHPHSQHYHPYSGSNPHLQKQHHLMISEDSSTKDCGSSSSSSTTSSKCNKFSAADSASAFLDQHSSSSTTSVNQSRISAVRPPEKRQRVPSAYNRFIKEEIQRIKAGNPDISHREAFSTAAKNWAHFPHIHFGLKLESNKQTKQLDHVQSFSGGAAADQASTTTTSSHPKSNATNTFY